MLTVLVANVKGGCGKTTVSTHLAAAFATAGLKTALADVDRQQSSLGWLKRRPTDAAPISGLDWTREMGKVPKKTDRLVIDAPAAMRMKQVEDFVREADVIVVPVLPGQFDEDATKRFLKRLDDLKPIRKSKTDVAIIGNRLRAHSRAAKALDMFLDPLGQRVATRLRDSADYIDVSRRGLSLFDLTTKRAETVRSDWGPLLQMVERAG